MSVSRRCLCCGEPIVRQPGERGSSFARRIYCDLRCQRRTVQARGRSRNERRCSLDEIPTDTPEWFDWVAVRRALADQPVGRPLSRREQEYVTRQRSIRYQKLRELNIA